MVIAVADDVTTVRKVEDGVFAGVEDVTTSEDDGESVEEGTLAFVEDGCEPPPAVPDG